MKKLFFILVLFPLIALSQDDKSGKANKQTAKARSGLGLKAGFNFANVTKASSISSSNETGYMIGVFFAPPSKALLSFRMEVIYSKQGYDYKTNSNTGTVDQHYIILPMLTGLNLGKFAQLQFGMQTSFLLNAKADSSSSQAGTGPSSNPYGNLMKVYNRFNYGLGAGLEIYPYKGILIGARYNMSFGDMYKTSSPSTTPTPSFLPSIDAKNNVVQLYLGYRF